MLTVILYNTPPFHTPHNQMDTFFDLEGDRRMEEQNAEIWRAIFELVFRSAKDLPSRPWSVLDVGCHTGGLLEIFEPKVAHVMGVEPLDLPRREAGKRLPQGKFYPLIDLVPDQSVDVAVSHEALYLIEDLDGWIRELKRILRPDGGAFLALGSHTENTAWMRWRTRLGELYGHTSYPRSPMEILAAGHRAGFHMELARLLDPKPRTSMRYSPPEDGWGEFVSSSEALGFQEQKLVFTFYPK